MNKKHFTEWFKDTLLPKLLPQSVIVMDNAPYHSHLVPESRVPNTGSRKPEILAWLDRSNINYPENAIKAELLEFVKQNKPCSRYVIDELTAEHGHEVLRLPPRHCELNPIEMAKSRFNKERWAKFQTHVSREVEEKLWLVDGIRDDENIPYIIDMTVDDNDDSDIDDYLDEGEGNDMEIDSDLEYYLSDGINNSDVSKLCDICHAATPPKQKKKDKEVQWFQCVYCKRRLHEKCSKGAARKGICVHAVIPFFVTRISVRSCCLNRWTQKHELTSKCHPRKKRMTSRTIVLRSLENKHDIIKLHAPEFYTINKNLDLYQNAREAIMRRYIHGDFAIVEPDPCLYLQLTPDHADEVSSSSDHTWSHGGTCSEVQTVTYVPSSDSTYDNSMSLFSGSSHKTDVTVKADGSVDLFSSNRENSSELSASQQDYLDEVLSATNDVNETSSCDSERVLKQKTQKRRISCASPENIAAESATNYPTGFLCHRSSPSMKTSTIGINSTDSDSDCNVFKMRQEQTIRKLKNQISENDSKKEMEYMKLLESKNKQFENLSEVIKDSKMEIEDLHDNIEKQFDENNSNNEMLDKMKFKTRDSSQGRPYNSNIRQIYYFMRSRGVGVEHISSILKYIFDMFNIQYSELPSSSSAVLFDKEMNILSKEQMSEIFNENDNLTMHRDATTKSGRHFYAVELSNAKSTYTLGLQELADGRAETYAKSTNEMISDINDVCTANPDLNIMSKIKNFMTDRSATEEKTNRILMDNSNNNTINSFKCSCWDVCDKSIKEIEKGENFKLRDGDKNRKDTYISILLNSVSKLFYKDGSGDPTMSNVYLKSQGIDNNPIETMRVSRFNVQFNNAGGIFILKHVILKYFLQSKMALNYTQQLIVDCLQNKTLICICQALGMICKTITGPYWKVASDKKTPIKMGHIYTRLIDVLDNIDIFTADENRDKTELFISRLCFVIMEKAKKIFSDFLCGGKFFKADDYLKTTARTCPSNNITVERMMGKLDSAIKQSPNSSVGAIETKIVYNNNKTQNWLDSKSNTDKKILLKTAIKNRKQVKYWKENEELEEGDLYNLSVAELKEDFQGKLLTFKGIGDYLNCIVE
ncbi:unnamed protein product [Mytilus coruscus]|uniref:Tc1-like transposase DDE domain-containing protein n=1 Tax=Mytilus coruscus TaxID=42192 RepID=A0A6J8ATB1_MYTCO|nr:unnamed protein product [Mytilus coruscus]